MRYGLPGSYELLPVKMAGESIGTLLTVKRTAMALPVLISNWALATGAGLTLVSMGFPDRGFLSRDGGTNHRLFLLQLPLFFDG